MAIDKAGGAGAEVLRQLDQQQQAKEQQDQETLDAAAIEQRRAKEQGSAGQAGGQALDDPQVKGTSGAESTDGVGEVGEAAKSGVEKHDEAVDVANAQQDRGESWQEFASTAEASEIPPSVEDQARQADDDAEEAEVQKKVKVEDLLKEMTVKSGKIPS